MTLQESTYKFIVDGLIRQINAKYILEIGLGREANTADVCLKYLAEKGYGKYVVLDFNPLPEALEIINQYDKKLWELRLGDTTKDDQIFQNCHDNRFDLILIDGSHWWTHVINDVQKVLVNGCAKDDSLFVFHDTSASHVRQAIIEIGKAFKIDLFHIPKANLCLGQFRTNLN